MADLLTGLIPDDHVPVVDSNGNLTSVPQTEWTDKLVKSGYRPQTPEEQKKFYVQKKYGENAGQELATGLEGAARALTFGVSDIVEPNLLPTTVGEMKGRELANPGLETTGEIGGVIAGLAVPGLDEVSAPGLISKVGEATYEGLAPATRLGRFAAKAISGGIEGSLFSAGNAVSESQLGDSQLNAEKLVSHFGLGAFLGSAGGLFGEALDQATEPVFKYLEKAAKDAPGILRRFAANKALNSSGRANSFLAKMSNEEKADLYQGLSKVGIFDGNPNAEELLKRTEALKETIGSEIGEIYDTAHKSGISIEAKDILKDIKSWHDGLDVFGKEAVDSEIGKIERQFTKTEVGPVSIEASKKEALKLFNSQLNQGVQLTYDELKPAQKALFDRFYEQWKLDNPAKTFEAVQTLLKTDLPEALKVKNSLQNRAKWAVGELENATEGFNQPLKRQLAGVFRDSTEKQLIPQLGSDTAKKLTEAQKLYGQLSEAEKIFTLGTKKLGVDPVSYLTGGFIGGAMHLAGAPGAALVGIGSGLTAKAIKERGGPAIARLAMKISENPVLKSVAESFAGAAKKSLPVAAFVDDAAQAAFRKTGQEVDIPKTGPFGKYTPLMSEALAKGPEHALATHLVLSKTEPDYAKHVAQAGLPAETPQDTKQALEKAAKLLPLKNALDKHDQELSKQIDKAIKGGGKGEFKPHDSKDFGAKRTKSDLEKGHKTSMKEVKEFMKSPTLMAEKLANNLGELSQHAPELTSYIGSTASRVVNFLNSKLPEKEISPAPLAPQLPANKFEMQQFARYMDAVKNPERVLLQELQSGCINPETKEAISTCYPELLNNLKDQVISKLTDPAAKTIKYSQKVQLGLLLGADVDGTMSGNFINSIQMSYNTNIGQNAPQPMNQAKPSKTGEQKLTLAERSKTPMTAAATRTS